jgi:hypothetical protein
MKKYILLLTVFFGVFQLYSQSSDNQDDEIYQHIREVVANAAGSLDANSDPYGFTLTVKMSKSGSDGKQMALYKLSKVEISNIVQEEVIQKHFFNKFNLNTQPKIAPTESGIFYMTVGLTPATAPQIGYDVNSNDHNEKESGTNITYKQMDIQISAIFLVSTPNDGSVQGKVFYKDLNGSNKEWNLNSFPTTPTDKKGQVRYRRLGPGDDNSNSGSKEPKEDWVKIGNFSPSDFQVQNRTPGHYFPSVKLRGCIQKFENEGDPEAIVTVKGSLSWDNRASASATKETNKDVFTDYSKKNIVKGKILDKDNRPSKGVKTVVLEPKDWEKPDFEPDICITTDENFEFKNVESGVYWVYVKGQPKETVVEVCNCNGKGPNATYTCTIGGNPGYFITMETEYEKIENLDAFSVGEYGSSGTGQVKETAKTKIVWQVSEIEIVGTNGYNSFLKGIYDYPLEKYNTSKVDYQVPQFSYDDGKYIDERKNWTTDQVPQGSLPYISTINDEEVSSRKYKPTDTFSILPMYDDTEKKSVDLSGISDQGMKKMLNSLEAFAKAAKPLADEANNEIDGKIIEKSKIRTFTLAELVSVAKGSSMSLSDKVVRRTEKQADNFLAPDEKTVAGMRKLGKIGDVDFGKMAKAGSGGTDNFVMTNNYNRPVTTTITRKIKLRRATETEIKEAKVKNNDEIIEEVTAGYPDGIIKKIIVNY